LEKLGEGGMGEVYLAEDTSLRRKVALKFLPKLLGENPIARRRFVREAQSAAALDHPFICNIHEVGQYDDQDFLVMEYVEGETLMERLGNGPLPLRQTLQIALEIAQALGKAHQSSIIHRDLKPANIMLTTDGHPKVMDFGLAKRMVYQEGTQRDISSALTREGSTPGTLAYMSPEQVAGRPVDDRSDIFSFGIVLYEMLTGVHPFRKSTRVETGVSILNDDPTPLEQYREDVPDLLLHVVSKMLEKALDQRYQSIHEVLTDLGRLVEDTGWRGRPLAQKIRSRWAYLTISGGAVVILAAAYWTYQLTWPPPVEVPIQRTLTQFTFDEGLQMEPSWSPDGSLLAYASNRNGNFDIWVQSEEGDPIQITKNPNHDWQPDWSPNGKHVVFRSERDGGGLFCHSLVRRARQEGRPVWIRTQMVASRREDPFL
jgi:serine/threonine protein kinase